MIALGTMRAVTGQANLLVFGDDADPNVTTSCRWIWSRTAPRR